MQMSQRGAQWQKCVTRVVDIWCSNTSAILGRLGEMVVGVKRMAEYVTIACDVCFLTCVFCVGVASYDLLHTSYVLVSIAN